MKCENVPKALKKSPVLCTTPKTTFTRCRQMEDGGNHQFAHAQREKFCQFQFRLPSCVDTILNLKVSNKTRNATRAFNKAFDSNTLMSSDESMDQPSLETNL